MGMVAQHEPGHRAALGRGGWLFGPLPEDEVERLVGHAAAKGRKRLGLLGYDTEFGRYAMQAAKRAAFDLQQNQDNQHD